MYELDACLTQEDLSAAGPGRGY